MAHLKLKQFFFAVMPFFAQSFFFSPSFSVAFAHCSRRDEAAIFDRIEFVCSVFVLMKYSINEKFCTVSVANLLHCNYTEQQQEAAIDAAAEAVTL